MRLRKLKLKKTKSSKNEEDLTEEEKVLHVLLSTQISPADARVIAFLRLEQLKGDSGWTRPLRIADICKAVDRNDRTIGVVIKKLKKFGWLESADGKGRVKKYHLKCPAPDRSVPTRQRKIILRRK